MTASAAGDWSDAVAVGFAVALDVAAGDVAELGVDDAGGEAEVVADGIDVGAAPAQAAVPNSALITIAGSELRTLPITNNAYPPAD